MDEVFCKQLAELRSMYPTGKSLCCFTCQSKVIAPSSRILNWQHPCAQKGFMVLTHICPHHVCTSINNGFRHNKNNFVINAEEYLGMYNSAPVPSV